MHTKHSWASNFLLEGVISLFIPLEDVLEVAQHSLETVSVDRSQSDSIHCLYAGLSVDVVN